MKPNAAHLRNIAVATLIGVLPFGIVMAAASKMQFPRPESVMQTAADIIVLLPAGVAGRDGSVKLGKKTYNYLITNHPGRTVE